MSIYYFVGGGDTNWGYTTKQPGSVPQSHFTDLAALQIYRVASLLLNFLCLQAEDVVKRAEEVEYVDLAHFTGFQSQRFCLV